MKLSKQKKVLESALEKLKRAQNLGSDCKLDTDEAYVVYKLLTDTAIRIANLEKES